MKFPNSTIDQPMTQSNPPESDFANLATDRPETSPGERSSAGSAGSGAGQVRRVELDALNAYYGSNHAVRNLNLAFEPGKVTAIIGPSGCGKSTMVRCVNRMHEEILGARA